MIDSPALKPTVWPTHPIKLQYEYTDLIVSILPDTAGRAKVEIIGSVSSTVAHELFQFLVKEVFAGRPKSSPSDP